jgi:hypothetical protein
MNFGLFAIVGFVLILIAGVVKVAREVRRRGLDRWLLPYLLRDSKDEARVPGRPVHLLLCVADHFEPKWNDAPREVSRGRVENWIRNYPRLFGDFRDSDGRAPRQTFFFPAEQYEEEDLDDLATLCRSGYGEVEIHLHHHDDTSENLRRSLNEFVETLANRHGLLARDPASGAPRYGFIHGDWALDNSRPDGRHCGVNDEIDILRETGCYADFTLPSYPSTAQIRTINSIYYAVDDPSKPRSHETGTPAGTGTVPENSLLMIQGPLVVTSRVRGRLRVPSIENGCLQGSQPATIERLPAWLKARVQVPTRPDWYFVKLHTHGAPEANQKVLLGDSMVRFHHELRRLADADPDFHYHYLTAREMANLVKAAEDGWQGSVDEARDYRWTWGGGQPSVEAVARQLATT